MLEGILHGIIVVLIVYLIIGLLAGLSFICVCIGDNILTGKCDPKFGPAWKSGMTYILAFSMACPGLNFFWVYAALRDLKKHVWTKLEEQS